MIASALLQGSFGLSNSIKMPLISSYIHCRMPCWNGKTEETWAVGRVWQSKGFYWIIGLYIVLKLLSKGLCFPLGVCAFPNSSGMPKQQTLQTIPPGFLFVCVLVLISSWLSAGFKKDSCPGEQPFQTALQSILGRAKSRSFDALGCCKNAKICAQKVTQSASLASHSFLDKELRCGASSLN